MDKSKYNGAALSVMGDSISTFEGYNPYGFAVYYKEDVAYENDLKTAADTWWMQVADYFGWEICVNNSYSGSLVADVGYSSACKEERCSLLSSDNNPDIILIYMGTNDRGYRIPTGVDKPEDEKCFYGGYLAMLRRIKKNYPTAKIVCATLPVGYKKDYENIPVSPENEQAANDYNAVVRLAAKNCDCLLADVAKYGERYETLDFVHPTAKGHKTIASLWIKCLKSLLFGERDDD